MSTMPKLCSHLSLSGFAVAFFAVCAGAQPGPTQAQLNAAAENTTDWLYANHGYNGQRYVDIELINRENVGTLRPVCMYQTGESGPFHAHPLVYQGVMYLTAGLSTLAIDATSCDLRWRHEWVPKAQRNFPMTRGVGLKDGKVIRGTLDGYLIALDAATGDVLWETVGADATQGYSFTMPPLIFEDLIIIGPAGSERGVHGWVGAFSLTDGSPVWRFNTIPEPGEPGAETWSDPTSELIGGGAVWTPFSFDADNALVYVAVSNPAPDFYAEAREGDNLYTNSLVVLDARTGELQWHYQATPHDTHDWDLTQATPLFETTIGGESRQVITATGKDGLLHLLDRNTQEHLYEVPITRRENGGAPVTPAGVRACPGLLGGVEWNGPAYHPELNLLYTPAVDWCGTFVAAEEFRGQRWLGGRFEGDDFDDARGYLTATDAATGAIRWRYTSPHPMLAAATTTSAGLVFTAELTGDFLAFDAADGTELLRFNTGAPNNGGVVTYAIDGEQYVGLMSGNTSSLWPTPPATATVIVFGLP